MMIYFLFGRMLLFLLLYLRMGNIIFRFERVFMVVMVIVVIDCMWEIFFV